MDNVKIGKYIAAKRKVLGLTQKQLAEKLGMSDKSVSKWERGICLPDVSVYLELCELLHISLNEFIAGEDLEQKDIAKKSEENLMVVTKDGERGKKKLKSVIAVLICICIAVSSILAWIIVMKNRKDINYMEPVAENSVEMNIAELLSESGGAFLYNYVIDSDVNEIIITLTEYKNGKETRSEIIGNMGAFTMPSQNKVRKGMIAVVPRYEEGKVKVVLADEGEKYATEFEILQDEENPDAFGRSASQIQEKTKITEGKKMNFLGLIYSKDGLRAVPVEDLKKDHTNDYIYCLSVEFQK